MNAATSTSAQRLSRLGLQPQDLARLKSLALQGMRALPGPGAGRRRSPRSGASAELMDYRNYAPGDDLRRLDWNVYARLEKLFLRVYRAEENRLLRILVDTSASMQFGQPAKLQLAAGLAAGLAFVGLCGHDRVQVAGVGGERTQLLRPQTGEAAFAPVAGFLAGLQAAGTQELRRSVGQVLFGSTAPAQILLLTDGLFPGGVVPVLKLLRAAGHEVGLLQILDPDELAPPPVGDWRLVDVEQASPDVEITLTPGTAARQAARMQAYLHEVSAYCRRQGIAHAIVASDLDPMTGLMTHARQAGLVG